MYEVLHVSDQQTDFGCFSRYINLWCFDGEVINVTDANYEKYNTSSVLECCMQDQVKATCYAWYFECMCYIRIHSTNKENTHLLMA